jgi:hypothetical protein
MEHIKPLKDALSIHASHYKSYGDYSVTQLIDTPRRVRLYKRHGDKSLPTMASSLSSFNGTGIHNYFETCLTKFATMDSQYDLERTVTEKVADRLITGKPDIVYAERDVYDLKNCKVWKLIFDPNMEEWTQQLNLYAYLLHLRNTEVENLYVIANYMDWIESQAVRDRQYPQAQAEQYKVDLWPWERTELFLQERIALHKSCEDVPDDQLIECTREERWERHDGGTSVRYAVLKHKKVKRATRVFDSMQEAVEYFKTAGSLNTNSLIEVRYARRKRCEKWCQPMNQFCNAYIEYTGKLRNDSLNDYFTYDDIHQGKYF